MKQYDAIVVGSGAAGGWAAKELAEAGLSVLVLEAGEPAPVRLFQGGMSASAWATRFGRHFVTRSQRTQELHPSYWFKHPKLYVDDTVETYDTDPERRFNWIRGNQLGGRTLLWGGLALRLSDLELGGAPGAWPGWPIAHAELDPWYAKVERFLAMDGCRDGMAQLPDGAFRKPSQLTGAEMRLRTVVEARFPGRRLISGRGIDERERLFEDSPWSKLTSVGTTLHAALATGRVTVRTGAAVSHVVRADGRAAATGASDARARAAGASGARAKGVAFVDRASGAWEEAHARLVVLCASTVPSVRILLSSAKRDPELAPQSDALGRYVMDHVTTGTVVELPGERAERAPLTGPDSFLVPRWVNLERGPRAAFAGGFGLWGAIQRDALHVGGGKGPCRGFIIGHGEMTPDASNRITLSGDQDRHGVDRVRIEASHGDNDRRMRAAMREAVLEIVEAAGGRTVALPRAFALPGPWRFFARLEAMWREPPPGSYVHEVGGARMGEDPRTSVVNRFHECWHVPNVLVTDGACWPTSAWQGPTHTIMATTARACAHAVERMRAGEI